MFVNNTRSDEFTHGFCHNKEDLIVANQCENLGPMGINR